MENKVRSRRPMPLLIVREFIYAYNATNDRTSTFSQSRFRTRPQLSLICASRIRARVHMQKPKELQTANALVALSPNRIRSERRAMIRRSCH